MAAIITVGECVMLVANDVKLSSLDQKYDAQVWLEHMASSLKMPLIFSSKGFTGDQDLKTCFADLLSLNNEFRRNRLLLCGTYLVDSVTALCLEALAVGYDVFLLTDLIAISDDKYSVFHWERLIQAGAVPTTMAQMLSEWCLSEGKSDLVQDIKHFSDQFRKLRTE